MPAAYAVRDGGDAKSKKQSMADLKLRRLQELNSRLKEDLERPRVKVAEASMRYARLQVAARMDTYQHLA
jgi:guanine nucleotide-binding protein subunit gamma, fungi